MTEHKTEFRMREIGESFCIQSDCEFFDRPAVQGHCHTILDDVTDKYFERITKDAYTGLVQIKEIAGEKDYLEHLESYYISTTINWQTSLDELVALRRDNARLKRELEKYATGTPDA